MNVDYAKLYEYEGRIDKLDLSYFPHILIKIITFLSFDELMILDRTYRFRYQKFVLRGLNCPVWNAIKNAMRYTANLTVNLDTESPMETTQMCRFIRLKINPLRINTLNLNLCYDFRDWNCPLATHIYNFTQLSNLKHLILTSKLETIKLQNLYHKTNATSYQNAFINLLGNVPKLRVLQLDEFPDAFDFKISDVLHSVSFSDTHMNPHQL